VTFLADLGYPWRVKTWEPLPASSNALGSDGPIPVGSETVSRSVSSDPRMRIMPDSVCISTDTKEQTYLLIRHAVIMWHRGENSIPFGAMELDGAPEHGDRRCEHPSKRFRRSL
jgi:hypothetical protein